MGLEPMTRRLPIIFLYCCMFTLTVNILFNAALPTELLPSFVCHSGLEPETLRL